jgi:hypothetical protein
VNAAPPTIEKITRDALTHAREGAVAVGAPVNIRTRHLGSESSGGVRHDHNVRQRCGSLRYADLVDLATRTEPIATVEVTQARHGRGIGAVCGGGRS